MIKDEALKLGIESLEWHNQHMHRKISEQAIAAMKEALAQPEHDWIERERAVGYREGHQNALKQIAQPEQEHVTWGANTIRLTRKQLEQFYPPQRKPLTEEEIENIANSNLCIYSFARAIEAAHGIKE